MLLAALVVLAAAPLHSDPPITSESSLSNPPRQLSGAKKHAQLAPSHQHNLAPDDKSADTSKRAPSCNGCARRESVLSQTMRLDSFAAALSALGPRLAAAAALALALVGCLCVRSLSRELLLTAAYTALYFVASPTAILTNKILMKDVGFRCATRGVEGLFFSGGRHISLRRPAVRGRVALRVEEHVRVEVLVCVQTLLLE